MIAPTLAKASYYMTSSGNKDDRINKLNKSIEHTGFKANKDKSNRDIVYYENPNLKQTYISHRGTHIGSKKTKQDLTADLSYLLGLEKHNKEFKQRANKTNQLIKSVDPSHDIYLTGHSYGGASIHHTLENKKDVLNRITKAYTYNPLTSPFNNPKVSKDKEKKLNEKIEVHKIQGDIPSASGYTYGLTKEYKAKNTLQLPKEIPEHLQPHFDTIQQLKTHSLDNFI